MVNRVNQQFKICDYPIKSTANSSTKSPMPPPGKPERQAGHVSPGNPERHVGHPGGGSLISIGSVMTPPPLMLFTALALISFSEKFSNDGDTFTFFIEINFG